MPPTSLKRKFKSNTSSPSTPPPSTKRERMLRRPRAPMPPATPKLIRTAPALSRVQSVRKKIYDPQAVVVSFKTDGTAPTLSPLYSPEEDASYLRQCFVMQHILGAGSFGKVICAKSKDDGQLYAIKYTRDPFHTLADRRAKMQEVMKHELLPAHPNLVEFIRAWEEKGRLFIQAELCERSLDDVSKEQHEFPEQTIWSYYIDVLMAVKHLHANDLLHADIKPENIFVTQSGTCKVGDFGLVLDERTDDTSSATEGDCKYLAAEVLNDRPTKAADIFSLGVTTLELATDLELPQQGTWWRTLRDSPGDFLYGVSEDLQAIIGAMMDPDPASRPSAADLLDSPIVQRHMSPQQRDVYERFQGETRKYEPVDMELVDTRHDLSQDLDSSLNDTAYFGGERHRSILSLPEFNLNLETPDKSRLRISRDGSHHLP